jgi:hypothetical protein
MFLFMALPSGSVGAQAPELPELASKRRIRAARSARCDTIPTSAATAHARRDDAALLGRPVLEIKQALELIVDESTRTTCRLRASSGVRAKSLLKSLLQEKRLDVMTHAKPLLLQVK